MLWRWARTTMILLTALARPTCWCEQAPGGGAPRLETRSAEPGAACTACRGSTTGAAAPRGHGEGECECSGHGTSSPLPLADPAHPAGTRIPHPPGAVAALVPAHALVPRIEEARAASPPSRSLTIRHRTLRL